MRRAKANAPFQSVISLSHFSLIIRTLRFYSITKADTRYLVVRVLIISWFLPTQRTNFKTIPTLGRCVLLYWSPKQVPYWFVPFRIRIGMSQSSEMAKMCVQIILAKWSSGINHHSSKWEDELKRECPCTEVLPFHHL